MKHPDKQSAILSACVGILIATIILIVSAMYDKHSSYKYVPTPKQVSK